MHMHETEVYVEIRDTVCTKVDTAVMGGFTNRTEWKDFDQA